MSVVTNPPRGLTSILGLNDMGRVPQNVSDTIVGTFGIEELCLLNRELIVGSNNTSPGIGGLIFTGSIVPPGELWYVWSAGVRTVAAAGESIRLAACYTQSGALLPSGPHRAIGGAAAEAMGMAIGSGFWLGPGTGLGVIVEQETGATKALNWYAVIVRLRV